MGLLKKLDYNAKITEIENEIPSICGLVTNTALTASKSELENKISNISSLVTKTDYSTKITEIEKKFTDHNHRTILLLQNLISSQQKFLM